MMKINKNDMNILQNFANLQEANFINVLNLKYDIDYYYGIIGQIFSNKEKLNSVIEDFDIKTKKEISEYIEKYGTYDDYIFFHLMEAVYKIFCKYYNEDGTLKDCFK